MQSYHDARVNSALEDLERALPAIVAAHGQSASFWEAFCERVSEIEDMAGADGWVYVNRQADWMLERVRIDPAGWTSAFDA
jgi:hypothetical protein